MLMPAWWLVVLIWVGTQVAACSGEHHGAPAKPAANEAAPPTPAEQAAIASARVVELTHRVQDKWRADIEAAHAFGEVGAFPPMLEVEEAGAHVRVTNLGKQPVCLRLTRVARNSTRPNDLVRCVLDSETCREIEPGATHRFQLFRSGNSPDCFHSALEFRVGTPLDPEPTWWSRTALEEFDATARAESPGSSRTPAEVIAMGDELESLLVESDRAARWRRELAQVKKPRR